MKKVMHKAESRGYFDHGWLKTHHTFSFARYYDPQRVNFGALRVLNDDTVAAGEGFGTHPHDNMEIVSIPLRGILEHADSMGYTRQLRPGMIQVMSAGTGITHSEYNGSTDEQLEFLQIWVLTDRRGHTPRYEDITLESRQPDTLYKIVGPEGEGNGHTGWIHQQAWFYLADLTPGGSVNHAVHGRDKGVYIFVIEGGVEVSETDPGDGHAETLPLKRRDGLGVWDTESVTVKAQGPSQVLLIEVSIG